MDDEVSQAPGVDPREMAAQDQATADRYQELADSELALRDGLRFNAGQLSSYGFDEAAKTDLHAANLADTIEDHAEAGNAAYQHAAQAWTRVAEDQTEEARLADQASAKEAEAFGRQADGWIAPYKRQQEHEEER